jgi:hypothetical protein
MAIAALLDDELRGADVEDQGDGRVRDHPHVDDVIVLAAESGHGDPGQPSGLGRDRDIPGRPAGTNRFGGAHTRHRTGGSRTVAAA